MSFWIGAKSQLTTKLFRVFTAKVSLRTVKFKQVGREFDGKKAVTMPHKKVYRVLRQTRGTEIGVAPGALRDY